MKTDVHHSKVAELRDKILNLDGGDYGIFGDGIIDVHHYNSANVRILWLLKEAVGDYAATEYTLSLIQENIDRQSFCPTLRVIAYVSHGILSGTKLWREIPDLYNGAADSLKKVAIVNVKKSMGQTSSGDNRMIVEAFENNKNLILEQIETYDPDVVIMGFPGACQMIVRQVIDHFEPRSLTSKQVGDCAYFSGDRRTYLWPYHPGGPGKGEAYCEDIFAALEAAKGVQ